MNSEAKNPKMRGWEDLSLPPLLGEFESEEIHELHRDILKREPAEPKEGLEPAPWWVWAISVGVIFAMGFYLGRYGGAFAPVAHETDQKLASAGAGTAGAAPKGDEVYAAICMPCHQAGGTGLEGKYPPLAGSEWLAKDGGIPVRIVLNGLHGPIQVKGKTIVNEMPALGGQLQDDEIAAVVSFVRSSWGNHGDKVTADEVARIRNQIAGQGPWTADKLQSLGSAK